MAKSQSSDLQSLDTGGFAIDFVPRTDLVSNVGVEDHVSPEACLLLGEIAICAFRYLPNIIHAFAWYRAFLFRNK